MWRTIILFNLLLMVSAGCAVDGYVSENFLPADQHMETLHHGPITGNRGVSNFWVGRKAAKLVAVRGEPDSIMNTAPKGVPASAEVRTVCYVYFSGTGAGCIDAYVVDLRSDTIIRYHCR